MKPYKLELTGSEFSEFYRITKIVFSDRNVRDQLSYLDFYNISLLIKRQALKLFNWYPMQPGRKKKRVFSISPNESKSFFDLLMITPQYITFNEFSQAVIRTISIQVDKQERGLIHLKQIS